MTQKADENKLSKHDMDIVISAVLTVAKEAGWRKLQHKGYGGEVNIYGTSKLKSWYPDKGDENKVHLELEKHPFTADIQIDMNGLNPAATIKVSYTANLADPESLNKLYRILKLTKRG